ncbi:MAG: hypothetical protein KUG83_00260 [Gammaproteobacteria bacterium]|nr:hypothetical protein [Gammaproteobacteria bacterium]
MIELAKVLDLPKSSLHGNPDLIVASMAGTILYRHLNRLDRVNVIQTIKMLASFELQSELISRCLDVLINPQWGEWSLKNNELNSIVEFHDDLNRWSGVMGGNPGAYGVAGASWSIIKQGAFTGNMAVLAASVILVGIHEFSYQETQRYTKEIERRKTLNRGL